MNKTITTNHRRDFRSQLKSIAKKAGTGAAALVVAGAANAGALADSFTGEVTDAKAEMLLIGGGIMIVVGVLFFIRSGKKAGGG